MTSAEIEQMKADARALRRADLEQGRVDHLIGEPIFEKLDTLKQCAEIVARTMPGAEALVQTLDMAHDEIERLASALYMIAIEALVPEAFGDAAAFEKLDEIRQIHCSALLIAGGTLIGGGHDDDTATAVHVP